MVPIIKDRSLPQSQGTLESGGSVMLRREFASKYHEPSQFPTQPGVITEGPPAEGSSAYKAEGSSQPVTARVSGHSIQREQTGTVARLDRGFVQQPVVARPAAGETKPTVANIQQPRATISKR